MPRNAALTVKATEEITEAQQEENAFARREDTGIVHAPTQGMTQSKPQALEAQAIKLAELNTIFDPDFVFAMMEQTLKHEEELLFLIDTETRQAKMLELERLAALDFARERGVQEARKEHRESIVEPKLAKALKDFQNNQLPRIIKMSERKLDGTPQGEDAFKQSVKMFADRAGMEITWEKVNGEFKATAKYRSGT